MASASRNHHDLVTRVREGDTAALGLLWDECRPRLKRMVRLRLDQRLAARLDPSDVVQETYLDVRRQLASYLEQPTVSFYVWLCQLVIERLANIHEQHLAAQCRAASREVAAPLDSSALLARRLLAHVPSPSQQMREAEVGQKIQNALNRLSQPDREIILMRHFEDMGNAECAEALGLSSSAVTMRYGRALLRLKQLLITESH